MKRARGWRNNAADCKRRHFIQYGAKALSPTLVAIFHAQRQPPLIYLALARNTLFVVICARLAASANAAHIYQDNIRPLDFVRTSFYQEHDVHWCTCLALFKIYLRFTGARGNPLS
jgi:hypothetical protein